MERVRAALKRAGIADKDIQTSSISLNPEYRYVEEPAAAADRLSGVQPVNVKFRDIRNGPARSSTRWSPRAPTRSTGRT